MYKDNMQCRQCNSGGNETQEHLERCDFTREMRKTKIWENLKAMQYYGGK